MVEVNFSFLKQRFPDIYRKTKLILDYYDRHQYLEASIQLVEPLEIIFKFADRNQNPSIFSDNLKVNEKDFSYHLENLYNQGHINSRIKEETEDIWSLYEDYENLKDLGSEDLDWLILKLYEICLYLFPMINDINDDVDYFNPAHQERIEEERYGEIIVSKKHEELTERLEYDELLDMFKPLKTKQISYSKSNYKGREFKYVKEDLIPFKIRYPPKSISENYIHFESEDDELQNDIIGSDCKRLAIHAGPGTGKTFVLTERIKFLIKEKGISPESILVITFTNKATEELKQRLSNDLPQDIIDKMHISTIHSFCKTILRDNTDDEIKIINMEKKRMLIKSYFNEKFSGKSFIPKNEYLAVFRTFEECSSFSCDYDAWINFIKEEFFDENDLRMDKKYFRVLEENGLGTENFKFPTSIVRGKNTYALRWFAHKYLAVAEATKEYQELLEKNSLYDFDRMLYKTWEYLAKNENNSNLKYKNIFIDEFQDISPLQVMIFDLLLKNSDYFTIVGDINQNIYSFKGSNSQFFKKFVLKNNFTLKFLRKNYRSSKNIVDFNNKLYDFKSDFLQIANKESDGGVFYIQNRNFHYQAKDIVEIIKYLHDNNNVKYEDIALLFRSLSLEKIKNLITELKFEGIGYNINRKDSEIFTEFILIRILFKYLIISYKENTKENIIKLFVGLKHISYDSYRILMNHNDNEKKLFDMDKAYLEKIGIKDDDLEFFSRLNELRRLYQLKNVNEEGSGEKLTLLYIYNKILNISSLVDEEFRCIDENGFNNEENTNLLNLASLSKKIKEYSEIDKYDLVGLIDFMEFEFIDFSSTSLNNKEDCVNILSIHEAKGLEFPVVFLCNLQHYTFPMAYFEKSTKDFNNQYIKYPVFNQFLRFKSESSDSENSHFNEEYRLIYVANTRAKDLLIISGVTHRTGKKSEVLEGFKKKGLKELQLPYLNNIEFEESDDETKASNENKKLNLSFSSFRDYKDCKHKYDLLYNYGFEVDDSDEIRLGILVHEILNKIHTKAKMGEEVTIEYIDSLINKVIDNNPFIEKRNFEEILDSIIDYWEKYGQKWNIIDSEAPFTINDDKFEFKGKIDLIVQEDPSKKELTIIDFKTTNDKRLNIPNVRETYKEQLELYYHALSINGAYDDYEITKLKIFQIDGAKIKDKSENNFSINHDEIDGLLDDLSNVVDSIYEGVFDKNLEHCNLCLLKDLCHHKTKIE